MKNKEIALRVGTTEQVVKNYLRKVYDKLGVADRLELALYCLNHRVAHKDGDAQKQADQEVAAKSAHRQPPPPSSRNDIESASSAAAAASGSRP